MPQKLKRRINHSRCWNIKVRIASARNVCDSEHNRGQFHCTGWFIPGEFPPILFSFLISFYSSSISSLHLVYVHYPFASRARRGQMRIRFLLFAAFISTSGNQGGYQTPSGICQLWFPEMVPAFSIFATKRTYHSNCAKDDNLKPSPHSKEFEWQSIYCMIRIHKPNGIKRLRTLILMT